MKTNFEKLDFIVPSEIFDVYQSIPHDTFNIKTSPKYPDDILYGNGVLKGTGRTESEFTELCERFKGTVFQYVLDEVSEYYNVGRARIMCLDPRRCLSWHQDGNRRLHLPLQTNFGCHMVINNESKHLPKGEWWMTNAFDYHTAFNGGEEKRYHLVLCINDS